MFCLPHYRSLEFNEWEFWTHPCAYPVKFSESKTKNKFDKILGRKSSNLHTHRYQTGIKFICRVNMEDDGYLQTSGVKNTPVIQETGIHLRYHSLLQEGKDVCLWICKNSKNIFHEPHPRTILCKAKTFSPTAKYSQQSSEDREWWKEKTVAKSPEIYKSLNLNNVWS